jgi:hypothetical protein
VSLPADPPRLINARRFLISLPPNETDDTIHLLSPDVTYTVPGESALSGVFHGPAQVKRHLTELFEFTHRSYDVLKWVDWLLGENHVAALQYVQLQGSGRTYRGHVLFLVESDRNDALADIKVFFEDQAAANRFFSELPRP